MQSRMLRVLGSLMIVACCFGTLGCDVDVTYEQIHEILTTSVKSAAVDIGTAIVEAAVDATFD